MAVYFIGGSPCSGKSTVAQALSERYDLTYFKVDDHLDRYLKIGAADDKPLCAKAEQMTPDQIWMRDPQVQCEEELGIYEEIFAYVLDDLEKLGSKDVVTEGAAYLPVLAKQLQVPNNRYLSITPTKDFQVFHYSQREWVPYVLAECSDKTSAFNNWMERDALFAKAVQQQCVDAGYAFIVHHGEIPVDAMIARVTAHFELE